MFVKSERKSHYLCENIKDIKEDRRQWIESVGTMDVEKARALICVIEEKSISAAAEKLGYTPSGISRMMASLENDLGFALLIRRKEGVLITPECEEMLPVIRRLLRADEECIQMSAKIRGMEVGTVMIGTAYSEYYRWLAACVRDFHRKYPGIRLELSSGYSTDLVSQVNNHELDLCIVTKRENVEGWIPICEDYLVAWLPISHPLSEGNGVPLDVFATESYIDSNPDYETDNELIFRKNGIRPNVQMYSKDSYASWQMVEAGLGIGMNNQLNSRDLRGDVKVLPIIPEQKIEIGIAYSNSMTLAGRMFLERLENEYIAWIENV